MEQHSNSNITDKTEQSSNIVNSNQNFKIINDNLINIGLLNVNNDLINLHRLNDPINESTDQINNNNIIQTNDMNNKESSHDNIIYSNKDFLGKKKHKEKKSSNNYSNKYKGNKSDATPDYLTNNKDRLNKNTIIERQDLMLCKQEESRVNIIVNNDIDYNQLNNNILIGDNKYIDNDVKEDENKESLYIKYNQEECEFTIISLSPQLINPGIINIMYFIPINEYFMSFNQEQINTFFSDVSIKLNIKPKDMINDSILLKLKKEIALCDINSSLYFIIHFSAFPNLITTDLIIKELIDDNLIIFLKSKSSHYLIDIDDNANQLNNNNDTKIDIKVKEELKSPNEMELINTSKYELKDKDEIYDFNLSSRNDIINNLNFFDETDIGYVIKEKNSKILSNNFLIIMMMNDSSGHHINITEEEAMLLLKADLEYKYGLEFENITVSHEHNKECYYQFLFQVSFRKKIISYPGLIGDLKYAFLNTKSSYSIRNYYNDKSKNFYYLYNKDDPNHIIPKIDEVYSNIILRNKKLNEELNQDIFNLNNEIRLLNQEITVLTNQIKEEKLIKERNQTVINELNLLKAKYQNELKEELYKNKLIKEEIKNLNKKLFKGKIFSIKKVEKKLYYY